MLNLLRKKIFKNNHYSGSLLDPENWWCILAQFEKFEQIWGTVKGRTLKLKKRFENSICFAFHLSTYYYMYRTCKISRKCMPMKLVVVQNWGKMAHLPQPTTRTSFGNFIYITIFCNNRSLCKSNGSFIPISILWWIDRFSVEKTASICWDILTSSYWEEKVLHCYISA